MQKKPLILALLAGIALTGAAHATLMGRDLNGSVGSYEAYYDTDRNITWLSNANYGAGSIYADVFPASDGRMTWQSAKDWAANLSFTDGVSVYDNWRLPTTLQPDASCGSQSGGDSYGFGCTGSEMGHLFYSELGGTAVQSILTSADPDLAKFTNLQADGYWSATVYAPGPPHAWGFNFGNGNQEEADELDGLYALAVSPGDVAANNGVPEPQTLALVGLGLAGLGAMRRRG